MNPEQSPRLESWKEIAAYLQRDVKTAHRWEKTEGLPIHRHSHKSRSSVYAYPAEIDGWRASRKVAPEAVAVPLWKKPGLVATMALSLVMAGSAVRPQAVEAQGETRRTLCAGADCDGKRVTPKGQLMPLPKAGIGNQFSPDGSRVVFTRRAAPFTEESIAAEEVVVAKADGSKPQSVYRGGFALAWSADGRRLLMATLRPAQPLFLSDLVWFDIASGAVQKLPTVHANLSVAKVSVDGRYVAFNASEDNDGEENLYVMASDGSGETRVFPSAAYQEPLGWMPDGTLIYGQWGATVTLWAVSVSNSKVGMPVKTNLEFGKRTELLGLSRSGALYYKTISSGSDIYTATIDRATGKVTSGPVPVGVPSESTGGNVLPRWSPDSKRLAYMHLGPPREMYVFSFATGEEKRIAPLAYVSSAEHCWSQDGAAVFLNDRGKGVRVDVASGQMTAMAGGAGIRLGNCSGDVDLARIQNGIEVGRRGSESQKPLYSVPDGSGTTAPSISHDGKSVAWVTPGVYVPNAGATWVLHTISTVGGAVQDLATVKAPAQLQPYWGFAWSADDRSVYFAQRADEKSPFELMRVPATGGVPEAMGLKGDDIRDLDVAPDGTRLVYSIGAVNRPEIWELKGFLPKKK